MMTKWYHRLSILAAVLVYMAGHSAALADGAATTPEYRINPAASTTSRSTYNDADEDTYSMQEIIDAGHGFFGITAGGFAQMVEYVFQSAGRPTGYIIGEEGAGAFVGGLTYGEGMLVSKSGGKRKIFWQGPSIGFDFGGNGSRVMTLVYNMDQARDLFHRFVGVEGSAYFVGGFGVTFQSANHVKLAPIRTGVGVRLGANVGYLKYTPRPTWNPF